MKLTTSLEPNILDLNCGECEKRAAFFSIKVSPFHPFLIGIGGLTLFLDKSEVRLVSRSQAEIELKFVLASKRPCLGRISNGTPLLKLLSLSYMHEYYVAR